MADRREHPLLMKGALVVATLAGAKTQTRRLVTPGTSTVRGWSSRAVWPRLDFAGATTRATRPLDGPPEPVLVVPFVKGDKHEGEVVTVWPRVRPGDSLWVRETFLQPVAMSLGAHGEHEEHWVHGKDGIRYAADGAAPERVDPGSLCSPWRARRPGIHMPRWACRLVLPVASVRAERAQTITDADALAEGVIGVPFQPEDHPLAIGYVLGADNGKSTLYPTAREAFLAGFETINGHRAKPAGDWVWVYQWPARKDQ